MTYTNHIFQSELVIRFKLLKVKQIDRSCIHASPRLAAQFRATSFLAFGKNSGDTKVVDQWQVYRHHYRVNNLSRTRIEMEFLYFHL